MKMSDILPNPGRPIAYYPGLRALTGSTNATILLCQLIYWHGKQRDQDGWIEKRTKIVPGDPEGSLNAVNQSLEFETGLSYRELWTARRLLRQKGLVRERHRRQKHLTYFKIDFEMLERAWNQQHGEFETVAEASATRGLPRGNSPDDPAGIPGLPRGNSPHYPTRNRGLPAGKPLSTYIDYAQTTTETTAESPAAASSQESLQESLPELADEHLPSTPLEAMAHRDIKLFIEVCGRVPGHTQYETVIETMRHFRHLKGDATVEYLRPFWVAWSGRRRRSDGQPYDPGSLTWLTEWALNGTIPPENGVANARNPQSPTSRPLSAADLAVAAIINERERRRRVEEGAPKHPTRAR